MLLLLSVQGCSDETRGADAGTPPRAEAGADGLRDRSVKKDRLARDCEVHCDCPQGSYCYHGKCVKDASMPVYCCGRPGCPPGQWCVNSKGPKQRCAESTSHKCKTACDCGPAHCCVDGLCVKDHLDPWLPGGKLLTKRRCRAGSDATYCCSAPECHAGRYAYKTNAGRFFRCHSKATGKAKNHCGGKRCFGTACNCELGEVCADTVTLAGPGKACLLLSGGACVSHAVAEAVFGFKTQDLLSCCRSASCPKGKRCDAGWKLHGRHAYVRVEGRCGSCGDKLCQEWESPQGCPADCRCGDGRCSPSEVGRCANDCGTCGNYICQAPAENPLTCKKDCPDTCGDAFCSGLETKSSCPSDCADRCPDAALYPGLHRVCGDGHCAMASGDDPESCMSCPQDCGPCEGGWTTLMREPEWSQVSYEGIWGSSASNIFFVGENGTIRHHDGVMWKTMVSGTTTTLRSVWGSSATDVYAVGYSGTLLRFDGVSWSKIPGLQDPLQHLGVWASARTNVYVVGVQHALRYDGKHWKSAGTGNDKAHFDSIHGTGPNNIYMSDPDGWIHHFDGKSWSKSNTGGKASQAVWSSSSTNVYVLSQDKIFHGDGSKWQVAYTHPQKLYYYYGIWGSSHTDIFVVGGGFSSTSGAPIAHYDGSSWQVTITKQTRTLSGVWGSSHSDVYAAGSEAVVLHFDGKTWKQRAEIRPTRNHRAVRARSAKEVHVVGDRGSTLRYDGSWSTVPNVSSADLHALWGDGKGNLLAAGQRETVLRLEQGKWNWLRKSTGQWTIQDLWGTSIKNLHAVSYPGWGTSTNLLHHDGTGWKNTPLTPYEIVTLWGSSPTDLFIAGARSTNSYSQERPVILRTKGNTGTFAASHLGPLSNKSFCAGTFADLWGTSATNVFAVGYRPAWSWVTRGTIAHFDGKKWHTQYSSDQVYLTSVWGSSPTSVYAAGSRGTILRHDGKSWRHVRLDLREATSGTYSAPTFAGIHGTSKGAVFLVGSSRAVLRHCPAGACP